MNTGTETEKISKDFGYICEQLTKEKDSYAKLRISSSDKADRCKSALEKYKKSIIKNNPNIKHLIAAVVYEDYFIKASYVLNIFKPSSYDFAIHPDVLLHIKALISCEKLPIKIIHYLSSIRSLIDFSPNIASIYNMIVEIIKSEKNLFLKSVLTIANWLFINDIPGIPITDSIMIIRESFVEGCSYLVAVYSDTIKHHPMDDFNQLDIQNDRIDLYFKIIYLSLVIKHFIYAEMIIGKMPYEARIEKDNLHIVPLDDLEKFRVAGYSHHGIRTQGISKDMLQYLKQKRNEYLSISDESINFDFINNTYLNNGYTPRELINLEYMSEQFHFPFKELPDFKLAHILPVKDLLKLLRVFINIVEKQRTSLQDENKMVQFSSDLSNAILFVCEKSKFRDFLGNFIDLRTADNFISVFTANIKDLGIYDLQYTPILQLNTTLITNLPILIKSELIRNSMVAHHQRFYEDNTFEPLVESLYKSLKKKIDTTFSNVKIGNLEVDCVAITEKYIFIFEVKNTFLPTNRAEERTVWDHIVKASMQLNRIRPQLSNLNILSKLESKLGVSHLNKRKILTCIILGTRVFTGYTCDGNAVKYIGEATNFLDTGIAKKGDEEFSLWKSKIFTEDDLVNFVKCGGTNLYTVKYMTNAEEIYKINDKSIIFNTYK